MAKIESSPEMFNLRIDRQERYFLLLALHLLDVVGNEGEIVAYATDDEMAVDLERFWCEGMGDDFIKILKEGE